MPIFVNLNHSRGANDIVGAASEDKTITVTSDLNTTIALNKRGFAFGVLANPSVSSVSVGIYFCFTRGGTIFRLLDREGDAVSFTIPAGDGRELPYAIAGVPYLIIKRTAGDDVDLIIHLER